MDDQPPTPHLERKRPREAKKTTSTPHLDALGSRKQFSSGRAIANGASKTECRKKAGGTEQINRGAEADRRGENGQSRWSSLELLWADVNLWQRIHGTGRRTQLISSYIQRKRGARFPHQFRLPYGVKLQASPQGARPAVSISPGPRACCFR